MARGALTSRARSRRTSVLPAALLLLLAACGRGPEPVGSSSSIEPSVAPSIALEVVASPSESDATFSTAAFAGIGEDLVSDEMAAELQEVLDTAAEGDGLTAAVMSPHGVWSGATGFAAGDRAMSPDDQMSIASITKSLVAAQVMQLVEAGELSLDDLAADRLPHDVEFDTNGATIEDLLSMRSGIPENLQDPEDWESLRTDPTRVWTTDEVLATVPPDRSPAGDVFEYRGNNYLLLSLIVEQVTGQPLAEVLRRGVLDGEGYERLIYQPAERPTDPVAMPDAASADTFDQVGGYLPSLAAASALVADGNMASDALSLARWFKGLCAGQVVSAASLDEMTDFEKRPEYGLGLAERSEQYGSGSGALGHTGALFGFTTAALCFPNEGIVVVVLANAEHDVDTTAGDLWQAASD